MKTFASGRISRGLPLRPTEIPTTKAPRKRRGGWSFAPLCFGVLLMLTTGSISGGGGPNSDGPGATPTETGRFTDPRDGRTYRTVRIGSQWIMAENLAYKPEAGNFWAYGGDLNNVGKYGYLYDWETAKRIAPQDWHLPTRQEWLTLRGLLGGKRDVYRFFGGTMEKVYKQVIAGASSGFEALLGGSRTSDGRFMQLGKYGYFWSSTMGPDGAPWFFAVDSKPGGVRHSIFDSKEGTAYLGCHYHASAMSVRLFRD